MRVMRAMVPSISARKLYTGEKMAGRVQKVDSLAAWSAVTAACRQAQQAARIGIMIIIVIVFYYIS